MRIAYVAVLIGAGCVARNPPGLSQAESKSAGDALGNGIEDSAATFGPVSGGATADAACVTQSGTTTDADGDSIPLSATLTFNCTAMSLGYTGMLTGTETVMDTQPAAVAWAFTANANLHASLTGPGGGSIVRDWDGTITASQAAIYGPFALDRTLDATTVFQGERNTTTVTETNAWTVTYTPQVSWTPGGIVVTGNLNATGSWDVTVDEEAAHAMLATPTALVLTPSCETRITAGAVTASYNDTAGTSHTITVTWTACGQRSVTST